MILGSAGKKEQLKVVAMAPPVAWVPPAPVVPPPDEVPPAPAALELLPPVDEVPPAPLELTSPVPSLQASAAERRAEMTQQPVLAEIERVMAASRSIGQVVSKFGANFEFLPDPMSRPDCGRVLSEI